MKMKEKKMMRHPTQRGSSAHGGILNPTAITGNVGCKAWERANCFQMRAETEPETLTTDKKGVFQCPDCGFTVNWGTSE